MTSLTPYAVAIDTTVAAFPRHDSAAAGPPDAYRAGRVTLRELGRTLGLDVWATHDLLAAQGVPVAQGDRAETASDLHDLLATLPSHRRARS